MYVAIDIGGSKTIVAAFNSDGELVRHQKFATPTDYTAFLEELGRAYKSLDIKGAVAAGVAIPGRLDRKKGLVLACGNLPWRNLPIQKDIKEALGIPVYIENDAKLAGLSEANLVIDDYNKALYLTVSTGIGAGFIISGKIDPLLADCEVGSMLITHKGKLHQWENFASGKAIYQANGKIAAEIDVDSPIWDDIATNLATGIFNLIAVSQPNVIIIGGGVGEHLPNFLAPLTKALKALETPMVSIPPVMQAQRPAEAVIYGCYELIRKQWREHYG
jgi:glucokinase